jgi:hypothetical protein
VDVKKSAKDPSLILRLSPWSRDSIKSSIDPVNSRYVHAHDRARGKLFKYDMTSVEFVAGGVGRGAALSWVPVWKKLVGASSTVAFRAVVGSSGT